MFSCYLRLEQLPDETKQQYKIKLEAKTPRFDVTTQAGYFKPLKALTNPKGMIIFYLLKTLGVIDSPDSRRAGYFLQCKDSMNFSSIFVIGETAAGIIAYGEPPQEKMLKPKRDKNGKMIQRQNPFYNNRTDGYLFLITPDYKTIEILIVPNGRYLIQGTARRLSDGYFDEAIKTIRETANPVFQY